MPAPSTATSSVTGYPLFTDPSLQSTGPAGANGFRLRPRSPALDAGVAVSTGVAGPDERDFFGVTLANPLAIGFSER
jgi:hypothetical protein